MKNTLNLFLFFLVSYNYFNWLLGTYFCQKILEQNIKINVKNHKNKNFL